MYVNSDTTFQSVESVGPCDFCAPVTLSVVEYIDSSEGGEINIDTLTVTTAVSVPGASVDTAVFCSKGATLHVEGTLTVNGAGGTTDYAVASIDGGTITAGTITDGSTPTISTANIPFSEPQADGSVIYDGVTDSTIQALKANLANIFDNDKPYILINNTFQSNGATSNSGGLLDKIQYAGGAPDFLDNPNVLDLCVIGGTLDLYPVSDASATNRDEETFPGIGYLCRDQGSAVHVFACLLQEATGKIIVTCSAGQSATSITSNLYGWQYDYNQGQSDPPTATRTAHGLNYYTQEMLSKVRVLDPGNDYDYVDISFWMQQETDMLNAMTSLDYAGYLQSYWRDACDPSKYGWASNGLTKLLVFGPGGAFGRDYPQWNGTELGCQMIGHNAVYVDIPYAELDDDRLHITAIGREYAGRESFKILAETSREGATTEGAVRFEQETRSTANIDGIGTQLVMNYTSSNSEPPLGDVFVKTDQSAVWFSYLALSPITFTGYFLSLINGEKFRIEQDDTATKYIEFTLDGPGRLHTGSSDDYTSFDIANYVVAPGGVPDTDAPCKIKCFNGVLYDMWEEILAEYPSSGSVQTYALRTWVDFELASNRWSRQYNTDTGVALENDTDSAVMNTAMLNGDNVLVRSTVIGKLPSRANLTGAGPSEIGRCDVEDDTGGLMRYSAVGMNYQPGNESQTVRDGWFRYQNVGGTLQIFVDTTFIDHNPDALNGGGAPIIFDVAGNKIRARAYGDADEREWVVEWNPTSPAN